VIAVFDIWLGGDRFVVGDMNGRSLFVGI